MDHTKTKIARIKVDALYGKKKHFNAADRKEKLHYNIGNPIIILNIISGSVLFYVIKDGASNLVKYIPLVLTLISTLLTAFQTHFNLAKKVEGHRRVGNKYLAIMKKCDRLQGYINDGFISQNEIIDKLETISKEIDDVNQEAEAFPTNKVDYNLAQKGIDSGEENYTEIELNM